MKVGLDTNILAYAEGINDIEKRNAVLELLRKLPQEAVTIPVQVLGELFNVLTRKAGRSRAAARETLLGWHDAFPVIDTAPEVMLAAADLATDHHLGIWDAIILSASSRTGCRLLLSEDLQEGFTWGGVTVVNPFTIPRHALLESLLESGVG